MLPRALLSTALLFTLNSAPWADAWSYVIGELRVEQQANFCDSVAAVDELAVIFRRFGAQTGFSALSSAPECRLEVHSFTPAALQQSVPIKLESGETYLVNAIRVVLQDGRTRYLITTRHLQDVN